MVTRQRLSQRRYPERQRARAAVGAAVRSGRLPRQSTQACADCGGVAAEYDHWHGYAREHWLDVQAVCGPCHRRRPRGPYHRAPKPKPEPRPVPTLNLRVFVPTIVEWQQAQGWSDTALAVQVDMDGAVWGDIRRGMLELTPSQAGSFANLRPEWWRILLIDAWVAAA